MRRPSLACLALATGLLTACAGPRIAGVEPEGLAEFVPAETPWAHLDTFAWRPSAKPGRPKGGEALGLRAAWEMLRRRYGESLGA